MTVGIGIIGTGGIARYHARNYLAAGGAEIVAVCDVVPERAAAMAAELGIGAVAADVAALVRRPDIDAVSICTPNDSHGPASLAAIAAGKHVLCEKPLAMSVAEARAMLVAAKAAGVHHMVNFSKRPFPGIVQLKSMIEGGELGELLQLDVAYLQSWLLAPSLGPDGPHRVWRLDPRVAGTGTLGDLSSHIIDLALHLAGPIERVSGLLATRAKQTPPLAIDDVAMATAQFTGGALGTITSSRVAGGQRDAIRLEIYGSKGAVRFSNQRPDRLEVCLGESNLKYCLWSEMTCPLPPGSPESLMAAFVRSIATGRPAEPTFADGLHCQLVMEAIEQSSRQGSWVAVAGLASL